MICRLSPEKGQPMDADRPPYPSLRLSFPLRAGKLVSLLLVWGLALMISALLVLAGQHWPEPLVPTSARVWVPVLSPPLLMGLWIAGRWDRVQALEPPAGVDSAGPGDGDGDEGQSCNSSHAQD